jgi:hypothetical protein
MFFLLWAAFINLLLLRAWLVPHWISLSLFVLCIASSIVLSALFDPLHKANFVRLRDLITKGISLFAVPGAIILIQCVWFGWQAHKLNLLRPLHQSVSVLSGSRSAHPRIIWIVLDELSYQQLYEKRFSALSLPAFDRLAKESTVFTRVIPAGIMTQIVMPSLIAGEPVDQIRTLSSGDGLTIHNPITKRWQSFDQHDTIFSDALNSSYSTALAGWYNPYCRILPEVLDRCSWTFGFPANNTMLSHASIASNALKPVLVYLSTLTIRQEDLVAELHIDDYRQISDAADKLLQNPSFDFILIHMPIPHPGGIYNRRTHSLAMRNSSYIDNLALADSYLAHVRSLLEATGSWDTSAVVIMGDHSWRMKLFPSALPDWTPEDQQASSGGRFDDRPAYIVKLPGQKCGVKMNLPFGAVDTRALFNAIEKKQVVSSDDLLSWVEMLNRERSQP